MKVVACVVRTLWPQEWTGRCRMLLVSAALLATARRVLKHIKRRRLRREYESAGKDVVVLHQFVRGRYCPNLSPFALKLEAFFRLANIKYVVDSQTPFGPKGRCPWITINGEEVADSEFILEHLTHRFNLDLDAHIDPRQAAVLEAVRVLADEHLFWWVLVKCYTHIFFIVTIFTKWYRHIFIIVTIFTKWYRHIFIIVTILTKWYRPSSL
ncbi:failed axon connections homolog [Procambarus clarkii]|uniref:failed axon connections homolog n=1 Tax=Procambarus clarkii TaxID=6728 RepID=UPI0037446502